jgi:phage N-6-adenine-methyltransferase
MTPLHVVRALGQFDLDPCTNEGNWIDAHRWYTIADDGLDSEWRPDERVWLNPPYSEVTPWMARLSRHGKGTALVFARTEVDWWHEYVWPKASAIMFLRGRLTFYRGGDGLPVRAAANAGGPSALIAYGPIDKQLLRHCHLAGAFVDTVHYSGRTNG